MQVHIFIPCFIDQLYPSTAFNMVKVLEKFGCEVIYNPNQTCCGQPAFNAGFWGESRDVCSKFLNDFTDAEYIVMPSASCAGFIKNYYDKLFEHSSFKKPLNNLSKKVMEFTQFLTDILKVEDTGASFPGVATYHDSCAALRECLIKEGPRKLLKNVRGLQLTEMEDTSVCCGFGGSFAVKFEAISIAMAEQKIDHAKNTKAQYIISTDLSCLMHLDGCIKNKNAGLQVLHIADVLAAGW